jgi:hypothetical protein
MVQAMHPPHKFEPQKFKMVEAMGLNVVASKSPAKAKISSKLYQVVQKLLGGQANR